MACKKCDHWHSRNWSKVALEWNLANDRAYNPHTPGGCTECKGALHWTAPFNRNVVLLYRCTCLKICSARFRSNCQQYCG